MIEATETYNITHLAFKYVHLKYTSTTLSTLESPKWIPSRDLYESSEKIKDVRTK